MALAISVLLVGCSAGSTGNSDRVGSEDPSESQELPEANSLLLPADAFPLKYRPSDPPDDAPIVPTGICQVPNLTDRVEVVDSAHRLFQEGEGLTAQGFSQTVIVTPEAEEFFAAIRQQISGCGSETTDLSQPEYEHTITRTIRVIDGADVGDEALWYSSEPETQSTVPGLGGRGDPSVHLIFRQGDALISLHSPGASSVGVAKDILAQLVTAIP